MLELVTPYSPVVRDDASNAPTAQVETSTRSGTGPIETELTVRERSSS